jgi:hypothetical protein
MTKFTKDIALYQLNGGYINSPRITRETLERFEAMVKQMRDDLEATEDKGGKLFITPLKEESRAKFSDITKAPHFFFKYLTKAEVENFSSRPRTNDDSF